MKMKKSDYFEPWWKWEKYIWLIILSPVESLIADLPVNPLMLTAAKTAWQFWWNLSYESIVEKIFEGEM